MDTLKNQIIDNIISILSPLRKDYPEEINTITNDLINGKTTSLQEFVNNHYQNLNYRIEIKDFITKLVDTNLLDASYKDVIKDNYEFISLIANNILEISSKPLNVKDDVLEKIKKHAPTPKLEIINHEYAEINFEDLPTTNNISNNLDDKILNTYTEPNNEQNNDTNTQSITTKVNLNNNITTPLVETNNDIIPNNIVETEPINQIENNNLNNINTSLETQLDNNKLNTYEEINTSSYKQPEIEVKPIIEPPTLSINTNLEINNQMTNTIETEENTKLNEININDLRKKILDAQLNYLNNASEFINNLEIESEEEIYNSLIDLNDIRYIQHSLSKLSKPTLERLLEYTNTRLNDNFHNTIDTFIINVIKKYLH